MTLPRPEPAHYYGVNDAGRLLGVSRTTIYQLIRAGRLKPRKIGTRTLVAHVDLEALLASIEAQVL